MARRPPKTLHPSALGAPRAAESGWSHSSVSLPAVPALPGAAPSTRRTLESSPSREPPASPKRARTPIAVAVDLCGRCWDEWGAAGGLDSGCFRRGSRRKLQAENFLVAFRIPCSGLLRPRPPAPLAIGFPWWHCYSFSSGTLAWRRCESLQGQAGALVRICLAALVPQPNSLRVARGPCRAPQRRSPECGPRRM